MHVIDEPLVCGGLALPLFKITVLQTVLGDILQSTCSRGDSRLAEALVGEQRGDTRGTAER